MILVSACLAGIACAHTGRHSLSAPVRALVDERQAFPVCPEALGGLPTPREACEIRGGDGADVLAGHATVRTASGLDVTAHYIAGAQGALDAARRVGATRAILRSHSPSCGRGAIYDGTFTRTLRPGDGVAAALLTQNCIDVVTEKAL